MIAHFLKPLLLLTSILLLTACGGSTETTSLTNKTSSAVSNYSGPAPSTEDIQRFKLNLWDNLSTQDRCGNCHGTKGQTPTFVEQDDINLAYGEANKIVNLSSPGESKIVSKVAGGHHCWLTSNAACADTIRRYIEAWTEVSTGSTSKVLLTAPKIVDPGANKNFPEDTTEFGIKLHNLLVLRCSGCHTDTSKTPQSPYFGNSNIDTAYEEVKSKIDLTTPSNSRLVLRLKNEFHNCWSDCSSNATTLLDAITAYANTISITPIDPKLVTSKALKLTDGVLANSGGRHEENVIALYEFKAGKGDTAFDTAAVSPALNLTLSGNVEWVGGWGIKINDGKAQGTTDASRKLYDKITATGEYSIEAWVVPANVTQEGPASIVSYSAGVNARNFTLGQSLYNYNVRNRSSTTNANGEVPLTTLDAAETVQTSLQHVVVTYSPSAGRKLYVNGKFTGDVDPVGGGTLTDWDDTFAFVLGNEVSGNRLWQGTLKFVAIHNRALTPTQISENFKANVGEKFLLLFSTEAATGLAQSYVVFEVSQYDSYSYLFNKPYFISLDPNVTPDNVRLKGMRLSLNGHEVKVGQAFNNVDVTLSSSNYSADTGQPLSNLGTIIALEKGQASDEFFLTFEVLGDKTNVVVEAQPSAPSAPTDSSPVSDIGLKTFDEINASMSSITGVSTVETKVKQTFDTIKQQLPSVENVDGFVSSQQMAVTQLAIAYCNALVNDSSLRTAFFTGFDFSAPVSTAFNTAGRNAVIDALNQKAIGTDLSTQPDATQVKTELNALISRLVTCDASGSCAADRTLTVVKASCAAVLGSAAILIQ